MMSWVEFLYSHQIWLGCAVRSDSLSAPIAIFLSSRPGTFIGLGEMYNEIDTVAWAHNTQRKSIYVDGMTGAKCPVNAGKYW